jgi:superfamily II DNA or RNA helicase
LLVSLKAFAGHVSNAIADSHPAGGLRCAAQTTVDLHAYQLEPALAMFCHGHTRVLVVDDVGLGKTVEAGYIVNELVKERRATRALVLVPAGLREQWRQELARLFGIEATIADSAWLAALTAEMPAESNPWQMPGIFLASQDLIKRPEVLRPLEDVTWDLVVVDEAHGCSVRSDRRAAVDAVASRAQRVVLLTATPPDDPADLTALCDIGQIPGGPPVAFFRRTRQDVAQGAPRSSRLMFVSPSEAELRVHDLLGRYAGLVWRESRLRGDDLARLAVITLRKRALSSARSLAVSAERRLAILNGRAAPGAWQLRLPLDPDEYETEDDEPGAALGAPGLANASRERRWLSTIVQAAQRAASQESKIRWLRRFLDRVREPALVFTEYRDTLQRLQSVIGRDRRVLVLHGGMPARERSRIQRLFNESPSVLLATDAASEGLNLHHRCRLVIHYELPWSTARLEQRAGRVDRLGQSRPVHELALVARTDAERVVLGPLLQRASRSGSGGLPAALSESQVAALIFGEALPAASAPRTSAPPPVHALALGTEAEREADRLRQARRLTGARRVEAASEALVAQVTMKRGRLERGIVAIYRLSFVDRAATTWHSQIVALHVQLPDRKRRPRWLLDQIVSKLTHGDSRIREVLAVHVEAALAHAVDVYRVCGGALQARQEGAARVRASAARQLVQAALFDARPALRDVRTRPATTIESPLSRPAPVLSIDVRLIGVLDVRRS